MSAIIEADIIENPHGDDVQIGEKHTLTITWQRGGQVGTAIATQNIDFYQIGSLIHIEGGWSAGPTAANATTIVASAALPSDFRPRTDVHIPIQVRDNATYGMGDLYIPASTGIMTIGATCSPTPVAFSGNATIGYNVRGNYIPF